MEVMFDRVAGLDVGKETVTVCLRTPSARGRRHAETRTFKTTTGSLRVMRDWLVEAGVSIAAMESTSAYWKAPFYCLEEVMDVWLLNAAHMKAVPGRKSDVRDAEWIAQLLEHGLLRPSFVPPPEIRRLRMLTRYRVQLMGDRGRDIVRLELMLELSRSGARCPDCSGPFPQTARRTRRAPLGATGSPRNLPLCGRQRPRGRDVPSVAVSGDRDRFEVEQRFPVGRQGYPPATGAGEPSSEVCPLPVVPRHQPPGHPMPHEVGKGREGVFADGVTEVG
jgi:Transposase